jgi:glycine cleavage system H protein
MFGTTGALIGDRKAVNEMTVLLVLGTFLVFIVLDYALNRRKAMQTVSAEAQTLAAARVGSEYVDGFLVPASVSYHSGHSWLVRERQNVVRMGADEFAAALMGKIEKIELPKPGQWIRQGQKVISFFRDGQKTEMVSATEGEVMAINAEVLENPALLRQDPYGKGWLLSVHVPDEENTTRNLIPRKLVGEWMREAVERLYGYQPALAGAVAADGGRPADDLMAALPGADWTAVTGEFFLTK